MKTDEFFNIESIDEKTAPASSTEDKTSCLEDDMQDLYSNRNYGLPSSRPTMISAKYRQKEERRKVLKLSMNKLKRIEDPESSLRRSVLINNTVKRLQREAKEDKSQKSQPAQNKCFGITSDFIAKQEGKDYRVDQLLDITNLQDDSKSCCKYDYEEINLKRKHEDECDVLSQFYLPPTPRMIVDEEDEDVNVVDVEPQESPTKKRHVECLTAADRLRDNLPRDNLSTEWSIEENVLAQPPFSCGHSSMLNEIVVYHNLIASLES